MNSSQTRFGMLVSTPELRCDPFALMHGSSPASLSLLPSLLPSIAPHTYLWLLSCGQNTPGNRGDIVHRGIVGNITNFSYRRWLGAYLRHYHSGFKHQFYELCYPMNIWSNENLFKKTVTQSDGNCVQQRRRFSLEQ